MRAIIADFGKDAEGVNIFRLNGTKEEIENAIADLKKIGCELWDDPIFFEKAHKHWSALIKVQIPIKEVLERNEI